jgi:hypothetical protein
MSKCCPQADPKFLAYMEAMHNNPPALFNKHYDEAADNKRKAIAAKIKDALDAYHKELKHVPNDEYYDLMDIREAELKKQFSDTQ